MKVSWKENQLPRKVYVSKNTAVSCPVLSLQNQVTSKISKLFLHLPGLACRVLQLGPVDAQFLGKVAIEVPYVASLKNGVREIAILKVK